MIELFRPFSVVENHPELGTAKIYWRCNERKYPIANCDDLADDLSFYEMLFQSASEEQLKKVFVDLGELTEHEVKNFSKSSFIHKKQEEMGKYEKEANKFLNSLLSGNEVEELKNYVSQEYEFKIELEQFQPPIGPGYLILSKAMYDLTSFIFECKGKIALFENTGYGLSVPITGYCVPFTSLKDINTVDELFNKL